MLTIDGSFGEGGGQVLRSSLSLSMMTGQAFRIGNIRAARSKPGLMRQHLTAVEAARTVCDASVDGAAIGSQTLVFRPGRVRGGDYRCAVGTAGSATLVLQTVLPALVGADEPSGLLLEGGTHNPWAPPFEFLDKVFFPLLSRMGMSVTATLERHGFFPAGGGRFTVRIDPAQGFAPLALHERGAKTAHRARALVSRLPAKIAHRELGRIKQLLKWPRECLSAEEVTASPGPGNVVMIEAEYGSVTEIFTSFGRKGVPSTRVAESAVQELRDYLATDAPVGQHLADQLLLPLALAGGSFRTGTLTEHTATNVELIRRFVDVGLEARDEGSGTWLISVVSPLS